jgi:hypothetical protein
MIMSTEDFLEHHGVKGMRWGHRSRSQKLGIVGAGAASYLIGLEFSRKLNLNRKMTAVVTGSATVAGVNGARAYLNRFGEEPVSSLTKKK